MALGEGETNLLLLAFFFIFLTVRPRQRRLPPSIDLLELSVGATTLPYLVVAAWLQRFDGRFWWVEPRQYVYHDVVEDDVWHTSHDMLDKKYLDTFRMSFLAFEQLVLELTPFLECRAPYFVRAPIPVRKQVKLVIYRLACGHSCEKMNDLYGCGASTIRKYTDIVCRVLSSQAQGIFTSYIHTPTGDRLQDIMERFRNSTGLPNICGAIDGTHIPLSRRPSGHLTPMAADFFNRKKFHSVVLQGVCDMDRLFWNVCAGQPGGVHDAGQF
jgi:DDE superfamily endonuclease